MNKHLKQNIPGKKYVFYVSCKEELFEAEFFVQYYAIFF